MSISSEMLQKIGWQDETLPVANEENKSLLLFFATRTKELENLKSETGILDAKQKELSHHRKNLQWEHQENMHLLGAYKKQSDDEEHFGKITYSKISKLSKNIETVEKESNEVNQRSERIQGDIGKVLRKIELLRGSVGGERGALDEWRSALKRREADIDTINRFSKEDNANIAELERKRQRLKVEHDKKQELLTQLCKDLLAEERGAETLTHQINLALAQRRSTVGTWAGALENIRQRDKDITHVKGELDVLREFARKRSEYMKERENFLMTQKENNSEAERDLVDTKAELAREKQKLVDMKVTTKSMEDEILCGKQELVNASNELSNVRIENKRFDKEKLKKSDSIEYLKTQISKYKDNLGMVSDGSKTAAQRMRQLEDMLKNEERYIPQLVAEQTRLQHCTFLANEQILALKEKGRLSMIESKGYKMTVTRLEAHELKLEKDLMMQQEISYTLDIRTQLAVSRLDRLEGDVSEMASDSKDMERVHHLTQVAKERAEAVATLAIQLTKLGADLRNLSKNLEMGRQETEVLRERLNEKEARVACNTRLCREIQERSRAKRAEECNLRLRAYQAQNALKRIADKGYNIEKARLDLEAAVSERIAEAKERRRVFTKQRRLLQEEKRTLVITLNGYQQRLNQLIKRYEISVVFMGKDENGEALSIAHYKVKIAQEKAELQEKGDNLDSMIRKGEREIASLEATLRVVDAGNQKFIKSLNPIKDDDPDMLELQNLKEAYDKARFVRKQVISQARQLDDTIKEMRANVADLKTQMEELQVKREDQKDELAKVHKKIKKKEEMLNRAIAQKRKSRVNAKKKINDPEIWKIHEKEIQTRLLSDANRSAMRQLRALTTLIPDIEKRALMHDIQLPQARSAPAQNKAVMPFSERSAASEQESQVSGSTRSGQSRAKGSFGKQLRAALPQRTPLSDSQGEGSSIQSTSRQSRISQVSSSTHSGQSQVEGSLAKQLRAALPQRKPLYDSQGEGSSVQSTSRRSIHSSLSECVMITELGSTSSKKAPSSSGIQFKNKSSSSLKPKKSNSSMN